MVKNSTDLADDNSRFHFRKTELQNHFKSAFTTIDRQIGKLLGKLNVFGQLQSFLTVPDRNRIKNLFTSNKSLIVDLRKSKSKLHRGNTVKKISHVLRLLLRELAQFGTIQLS